MVREPRRRAITGEAPAAAVEDLAGMHRALVPAPCARDNRGVIAPASVFSAVLALALPPRCPGCAEIVSGDHRFCPRCWATLRFLGPPCCAGCGTPFEIDRGAGARCVDCLARPPIHAGIHAAVAYGDVARGVALGLKYGGRIALAETAAGLIARVLPAGDLLVPVPLHRWRLWSRGYNQAALIGDALVRRCGIPIDRHALRRIRATTVLRGLGRRARAEEIRGAFAVAADRRARIAGKRLILIDDVYTSGATAEACARTLLAAGATSVAIACWARVLDDRAD